MELLVTMKYAGVDEKKKQGHMVRSFRRLKQSQVLSGANASLKHWQTVNKVYR